VTPNPPARARRRTPSFAANASATSPIGAGSSSATFTAPVTGLVPAAMIAATRSTTWIRLTGSIHHRSRDACLAIRSDILRPVVDPGRPQDHDRHFACPSAASAVARASPTPSSARSPALVDPVAARRRVHPGRGHVDDLRGRLRRFDQGLDLERGIVTRRRQAHDDRTVGITPRASTDRRGRRPPARAELLCQLLRGRPTRGA